METRVNIGEYAAELKQWEKLITGLQQENISFRIKLADLVSSSTNNEVILMAEKFNDEFAAQDSNLSFLAEEVMRQYKLLPQQDDVQDHAFEQLMVIQLKLRKSIGREEEVFTQLRESFEGYLNSIY